AFPHFHKIWSNPGLYFVPTNIKDFTGIGVGAFLAFYACIGFEDMVSMAEEVKNPSRNLPLAIAIVLVLTTALYVVVTLAALVSVPLDQLAGSDAPLALVIAENRFMP